MSGRATSAPSPREMPQETYSSSPSVPPTRKSSPASLFSTVKGIAESTLHVAGLAIIGEDHPNHGVGGEGQLGGYIARQVDPFESLRDMLSSGNYAKDAIAAAQVAVAQPGVMDDRKMLLEQVIILLFSLPEDSKIGDVLESAFVRLLWNDLQHPPISFVGKARFRSADGSGNNFFNTRLGAAGEPYARSVVPEHPMPQELPDNATIWDSLMKRDKFVPHPSGISSLLFAFATCITHSCFNTNRQDATINDASSYLDLSPLYGNNQTEQNGIRTFTNGKIHDDVVASQRLFLMPPSTCALMMVFSRNHNWIVDTLMSINQNSKYRSLNKLSPDQKKRQDEDLFQTARLVNCGWFLQVIFVDYIRVILNVNQTASHWALTPAGEINSLLGGQVARGTGNAVSIEFDLLYRWHACIGEKDTAWIEQLMRRYSQTPWDQMTPDDFAKIYQGLAHDMGTDPKKWTFGGLKRTRKDGTGRFSDDDLVRVLTEATEEVAGAFKARGVPEAMRVIDIMGMDNARNQWACATLNEFRSFLKLTRYTSFEQWNPDPVIANAARELYKDIENLELMPGLSAEEPKPSQAASGLAPGYTISRAILSDAVALVRGDRYLTVDFNPGNLTSFLYKDLQSDAEGGAFGGIIGKLLMRTFPRHYTYNSTYALFPFSTPSTTNGILSRLRLADQYDTRRPTSSSEWIVVDKRSIAEAILSADSATSSNFEPVYGVPLDAKDQQQAPFLAFVSSLQTKATARSAAQEVIDKAFFPNQFANAIVAAIAPRAKELISKCSWSYGTDKMRLNIVEQVIVPVCMGWISDQLGFPLKTEDEPRGLLTPRELYNTLCEAYTYVHLNYDATQEFKLRNSVMKNTSVIKNVIEFRLAQASGILPNLRNLLSEVQSILLGDESGQGVVMSDNARKLYNRVLANNFSSLDAISGALQFSMINFVSSVTSCAKPIDFYLNSSKSMYLKDISKEASTCVGLAHQPKVLEYVNEALRLDPAFGGFVLRARSDVILEGSDSNATMVNSGALLYVDFTRVNRDPSAFDKPDSIQLKRESRLYKLAEPGICSSWDVGLSTTVASGIMKEVAQLLNLRRAPGDAGQLGGIKGLVVGPMQTASTYVVPKEQRFSYFPQSMEICYSRKM